MESINTPRTKFYTAVNLCGWIAILVLWCAKNDLSDLSIAVLAVWNHADTSGCSASLFLFYAILFCRSMEFQVIGLKQSKLNVESYL